MHPEDAKDKRSLHALFIQGVYALKVRDLSVKCANEAEPKWQSALVLKNVTDFVVDAFSERRGQKKGSDAGIVLDGATDGVYWQLKSC